MKFKADEIASVIQKEIEDFRGQIQTAEVGRVIEVGDGIARCTGLSTVMSGEMLEFANGTRGFAFNLEENSVGVVILGDYLAIAEVTKCAPPASCCRCLLAKPCWVALSIARKSARRQGPVMTSESRPVEWLAAGVAERQP